MPAKPYAIIPIWQKFPPLRPTHGVRVFGAHRNGLPRIADHHRTIHWQIAAAAPDRTAPRPGFGRAMTRRRSGEPTAVPAPRIARGERQPECQDLPDQALRPAPVRPHLPHRPGGGRPVRAGAARFLIMDRTICLRFSRGRICMAIRSGSFIFAYAALTHDTNYEALLTLATKFYCWRTHFCRQIQPT